MVTIPPLSEGAYSQVRAALADRAAKMELDLAAVWPNTKTADELAAAIFWTNDAILTMAGAEEMPEYPPDATWTAT